MLKKPAILLLLCSLVLTSLRAQFYLRGEVKDENNSLLQDVRILVHSSGYWYHSGSSGAFGIPLPAAADTLTLSADGFQTLVIAVDATQYQNLRLRQQSRLSPPPPPKSLLSLTKDLRASD